MTGLQSLPVPNALDPLDLVKLAPLMRITSGRTETRVALIDGPLIVRPIFPETTSANSQMPSATPEELASAIIECIEAGAHVINLSAALPGFISDEDHRSKPLDGFLRQTIAINKLGLTLKGEETYGT